MRGTTSIQWEKGLFRLWLLGTTCWVVIILIQMYPSDYYSNYQRISDQLATYPKTFSDLEQGVLSGGRTLESGEFRNAVDLTSDIALEKQRQKLSEKQLELIRRQLVNSLLSGLGYPIFILLLGASLAWAIKGFSPNNSSQKQGKE